MGGVKLKETSNPQASTRSVSARQRAPTITIDTPHATAPYEEPPSVSTSPAGARRHGSLSTEYRPSLSISSGPASNLNLSPSTLRGVDKLPDPHGLLTVPSKRSTGSSFEHAHSISSFGGETLLFHSPTEMSSDAGTRRGSMEDDLFKPDPGEEHNFRIEDNPFAFSPGQLSKLFNPKSLAAFCALGGLQGIALGLRTDRSVGLSVDETSLEGTVEFNEVTALTRPTFPLRKADPSPTALPHPTTSPSTRTASSERYVDRKRVFGISRLPEKKSKSLWHIMWMTFNDKVLIILTIVATVSLILGLYQDFGQSDRYGGPKVRWVEGVTIMVAVAIVVVVGSLNDYQKERQFAKLNKKKDDRLVKIIRSGKSMETSVYDILSGDVLHLEAGDLVPADGVLISGYNVQCDESSVSGESDQNKKSTGDEVIAQIEAGASVSKLDPFIISGSRVLEGTGTYLVVGVGVHSLYGKLIVAVTDDSEATPTPLQVKLSIMAEQIAKFGCIVALLLFLVLFIKFLAQLNQNGDTPTQKAQSFLQIVIVAITIIVIAVPEGLPLAVTLALAFAMTKMLKDHNLVRVLSSCETIGNATAICSDKTGTLTTNKMTVVAGNLGTNFQFGVLNNIANQENRQEEAASSTWTAASFRKLALLLSKETKLLLQSIAINSTAFEGEEDSTRTFIGSKTETALLLFAKEHLGMGPVNEERENANVVHVFPFDSARKCMATVVRLSDSTYRVYVKGASEILLEKCTEIIEDASKGIKYTELTKEKRTILATVIENYAIKSLRTIGIVFRDVQHWPPPEAMNSKDNSREVVFEDLFQKMVFLGVVGIQDPLRPGVQEAVARCQAAGVFVRMVTGDNVWTAKAIAEECGIYTQDGVILEGPEFRKLSKSQMDQVIPHLQVLARSSPEDKRILVKRLKEVGETVAVTGDGTNDGPALRAADVGFSMGISGTEVAKEASSIILMDDNFSSIVKAIEWGRAVNDAVKKFLQFQLTVNITAVGVTFVTGIANPKEEPILTPVQLLWVNLIMDTFAALALATDPPSPSILQRKPDPKSARLITFNMWKMIIGQSIYQLIVTLVLNFKGNDILGYKTEYEQSRLETLIFNIYVWMQIFNQFNNRRLDNKFNIFEGITRNPFFLGINLITIGGQVLIIFFGSSALSTLRLNFTQWAISIAVGAISLPVGILVRLIPNDFLLQLGSPFRSFSDNQLPHTPHVEISNPDHFSWNDALENIRQQLTLTKTMRGGRLNALMSNPPQSPIQGHFRGESNQDLLPGTPNSQANGDFGHPHHKWPPARPNSVLGPAAAMAGVIAGSVASGWSPLGGAGNERE